MLIAQAALYALDQPFGRLDVAAMVHDTLASLEAIPSARKNFQGTLSRSEQRRLADRIAVVRATLQAEDAAGQVPGRDPCAS